ncbi:beta-xylosidase [Edaphobacter acidisoli]|uniref:Beta-xylosidase n=1 Tax=Edaphobacter acidisoli TaxID=2040573 RepID=A0A916RLM1_9BACT|nr:glycosyl hydrolase family 39 [Edaphobacter acidisoli]GGA60827.1 beta-xylosidase [Edaphobacter acidisoli]
MNSLKAVPVFLLLSSFLSFSSPRTVHAQTQERIQIDSSSSSTPFPHFWEQTFGSGRAILSLRQSYRDDLDTVKQATDFKSIRFHGIFDDEVGLYDPDRRAINFAQTAGQKGAASDDNSAYNFTYIDQIYDGLLAHHVEPYVELSFMPYKMSSNPNARHPFWYHPNVAPPKSYDDWDTMISAFALHLIARYGIDEVAKWKFEVWNEPNLDFWGGSPRQATYWELYDHTARALKAVSPRLQVGGPATAQAAWVGDFLAHIKQANVPADFVSTHVYANDTAKDVLHTDEDVPRDQMVYRAVKMVHEEIEHSPYPHMPLIFSEYNASYANEPNVTDSPFMGPWLANTIRLCDGLTESMDYWSFSDVFEEQGIVRTPFYGGYGLIATDGIPKPALNVFRALHKLGTRRIALDSDSALATRTAAGNLVIALWDYAPPYGTGPHYTMPSGPAAPAKDFTLTLKHVTPNANVQIWRIDDNHGNVLKAFNAMGRPPGDLTPQQVARLKAAGAMAPAEHAHLTGGKLHITVPAHGLAVLVIAK